MTTPTPLPDRLADEPPQWYARFCAWLVMPRPRSVLGVYLAEWEKRGKKKQVKSQGENQGEKRGEKRRPTCPPGSWDGMPELYQWHTRAAQWDRAESERANVELAAQRDEWRKKELEAAQLLFEKGVTGTRQTQLLTVESAKGKVHGNPQAVRVAAELLEKASNLARKALEMTTSKTETTSTVTLSVAEQAAELGLDMTTIDRYAEKLLADYKTLNGEGGDGEGEQEED